MDAADGSIPARSVFGRGLRPRATRCTHQWETVMTQQSHIATLRRYFDGCNRPDAMLMESTLAADAVHYFTNLPPVRGGANLAQFWVGFHVAWQARWTVERAIADGDQATTEWTLSCVPPGWGKRELIRGTEWYLFQAGKIAEIRAYYVGHESHGAGKCELDGFPYAERGYALLPKS